MAEWYEASRTLETWMCVRVFLCVGRGLASGRSTVQGVLLAVQKDS